MARAAGAGEAMLPGERPTSEGAGNDVLWSKERQNALEQGIPLRGKGFVIASPPPSAFQVEHSLPSICLRRPLLSLYKSPSFRPLCSLSSLVPEETPPSTAGLFSDP